MISSCWQDQLAAPTSSRYSPGFSGTLQANHERNDEEHEQTTAPPPKTNINKERVYIHYAKINHITPQYCQNKHIIR